MCETTYKHGGLVFKFPFSRRGPEGMGGGSLANEDAPPHPVKTYLHGKRLSQEPQNFQQWQEAKPRTSISKKARG